MKKILVYHLYVNDIITDNKSYEIHRLCLKHYKSVFDKMIFYICVNDLSNIEIINDAMSWVSSICLDKHFEIKVRKNTYLCESNTFKEEILEKRQEYRDCFIFVAHSKNATRLSKNLDSISFEIDVVEKSLINWCIAVYFYSLNFIDEMERMLLGVPRPSEIFYGSLLTQLKDPTSSPMLRMNVGNCFYSGCFFWINMNKFNNYLDKGIKSLPLIDDRFWLEMLPGVMGGRHLYGDGCCSHNDIALNDDFNLYNSNEEIWEYIINILGNNDEYWQLNNNIIQQIL